MALTTLIDTKTLADHLADPAFAIVDCRFNLDDERWGERNYLEEHIPRRRRTRTSTVISPGRKRATTAGIRSRVAQGLTDTLSRFGIDSGIQVVAYDQDSGMYASRFWWLLRWMGHEAVAVLDGGFAKWTSEGRPTARGEEVAFTACVPGSAPGRHGRRCERSGRSPASHRLASGRRARARALPRRDRTDRSSSRSHSWRGQSFFQAESSRRAGPSSCRDRSARGCARPQAMSHRITSSVIAGRASPPAMNLLALEHAGLGGAKLYPGRGASGRAIRRDRSKHASRLKLRKVCRHRNRWKTKRASRHGRPRGQEVRERCRQRELPAELLRPRRES